MSEHQLKQLRLIFLRNRQVSFPSLCFLLFKEEEKLVCCTKVKIKSKDETKFKGRARRCGRWFLILPHVGNAIVNVVQRLITTLTKAFLFLLTTRYILAH